jgi:hypothetical protein
VQSRFPILPGQKFGFVTLKIQSGRSKVLPSGLLESARFLPNWCRGSIGCGTFFDLEQRLTNIHLCIQKANLQGWIMDAEVYMEIIMSAGAPAQLTKLYPAQDDLLTGVPACLAPSDLSRLTG